MSANTFIRASLLSCGAFVYALQAQATPYFTAELGQAGSTLDSAHFESFNQSITNAGGTASLSETDADTAFSLGLGYPYSRTLAAEVHYLNLGTLSAKSTSSDTSSTGVTRTRIVKESTEQYGISAELVGRYALNEQWSLQGRLGIAWLYQTAKGEAQGESRDTTGAVVATESDTSKETGQQWRPVLGLGAVYQLKPKWQLQANWRHIAGTEPGLLGEQDLNLLSIGIRHSF